MPVLHPLVFLVFMILDLVFYIILASVILSWLIAFDVINTRNRFVAALSNTLYRLTEPMYRRVRKFLPDTGGIDLSPMVIILAIYFIKQIFYYYVV